MLLDDSDSNGDSDGEAGGVKVNRASDETFNFKINEEFARRFEHNKKREELQKCMFPKPLHFVELSSIISLC